MLQGGVVGWLSPADTVRGGRALSGGFWREFRRPGKCFRGLMANHSLFLGFGFPFSKLIQQSFYTHSYTGGRLVSASPRASDL